MKNILFFDRCELTGLYAGVGNRLAGDMHVTHVAYSENEREILKNERARGEIIAMDVRVKELFQTQKIDPELLDRIDQLIIRNTDGRFNLNLALQSDRGFAVLDYAKTLLAAQVYYLFWKEVFAKQKFDYFVHEPPSLYFNHIAAILCKEQGGQYIYHSINQDDQGNYSYLNLCGDDYHAPEVEKLTGYFTSHPEEIDYERCRSFLETFRKEQTVFLGEMIRPKESLFYWKMKSLRERCRLLLKRNPYHPLWQNIDYWLMEQKNRTVRYNNLKSYGKKLCYDEFNEKETYYYYSFHLEPEAAVLYLGGGIYKNQVKLIENIAASLPPGCYLYVKDHPHEQGYRSVEDYLALKKIPNVKLLDPQLPGKRVIAKSAGVFTINGTAGFEGLLMGKQVYTFAHSFYTRTKRVNVIWNIRELRAAVYANRSTTYTDDTDLYPYVQAFLSALHPGVVDYFSGRAETYGVDLNENADKIARDFFKYTQEF